MPRPFQTARCTWPMLAAAAGTSSKSRNLLRHCGPSSVARTLCTVAMGNGGAASWSLVNACRYGPARSSGSAASNTDSAWPNFIAPPLSCPRTLKRCSAVRSWISAVTTSDAMPPTRLPRPSAARPAKPSGNDANRAVRDTARRGISVTGSFNPIASPNPAPGSDPAGHKRRRTARRGGHQLSQPRPAMSWAGPLLGSARCWVRPARPTERGVVGRPRSGPPGRTLCQGSCQRRDRAMTGRVAIVVA